MDIKFPAGLSGRKSIDLLRNKSMKHEYFAAGMFAASKGNLEPLIMYGYGAYNLCGNSKIRTAGYVMLNATSPPNQSLKMSKYAYWKGEDELSRLGQTMGMEYYRKGYER